MLNKIKIDSESRLSEEQKIKDRRRNVIILIQRYLVNSGYIESATKLGTESNLTLNQYDAADNIDLYMILCEFEQFYEMKFMKPPKLVKKVDGQNTPGLPRIPSSGKSSSTNTSNSNNQNATASNKKNTQSSKEKDNNNNKDAKNEPDSLEIQGTGVQQKQSNNEEANQKDWFDPRVLKGLPDYSDVPEFQQLAAYLQRDICSENPNVRFSDIAGLDQAKRLLKEAVLVPLKYPHFFQGILEPWKGVLLFGPPGTGKTMLAKAVATECRTTFFNVQASSVVSKWRGESEKLIRVLFDLARHYEPSTIFIDEMDSIMGQRGSAGNEHEGGRRMKTELLIQLDGLLKSKKRVFLLAASNLPWDLDIAMLRRLEKRIYIPLPDQESRESMIRRYIPQEMSENLNYPQFAEALKNYSGSDIKLVCKEAAMKPLRRLLSQIEDIQIDVRTTKQKKQQNLPSYDDVRPGPVTETDFVEAMNQVKPSPSVLENQYQKWEKESGSC
ncbi:unnamed protein product [Paramecium primaurelia]|uniref:Katanin p60 ATPase-containing subunit A-like 2 n=1 Tax=Paramecium primaurelia TaxID=5886 RepID=A0A8S1L6K7_PARPR|nr:unnamed protein product [Paramecium primaurelia]